MPINAIKLVNRCSQVSTKEEKNTSVAETKTWKLLMHDYKQDLIDMGCECKVSPRCGESWQGKAPRAGWRASCKAE